MVVQIQHMRESATLHLYHSKLPNLAIYLVIRADFRDKMGYHFNTLPLLVAAHVTKGHKNALIV